MAGPVLMPLDNTVRYAINSVDGEAEWAAMTPGNGIIHLGSTGSHSLRCISILRKEMQSMHTASSEHNASDWALTQHCLNYMRQMLLCAADTIMDVVLGPTSHPLVVPEIFTCKDWNLIYDAVRINQLGS
ncbi:hypothetical protein B0H10DRAFT_1980202 [Mycena sp. CBHHK59/15]|nr:hypothetical protein B0H10DRAFT_1980202 [Mycena sp. CBHHK59/15]